MAFFNQTYGGMPPFANQPFNGGYSNLNIMKIDNGCAYFVALAPLFSLFLEGIAGDKIAAIILWVFTYILCVLVCKYDKDKVLSRCYDTECLKNLIFIPIAYLAIRGTKVTRQGGNCVALCVAALLIAIMRNGFVSYAMTSDENFIITIKEASYSEFVNPDEIENYLNPSVKEVIEANITTPRWYCETVDNYSTVTVTGEMVIAGNNVPVSIDFGMWYDGYKFEGIDICNVKLGENSLDENNAKNLFYDMYFIYYDSIETDNNYVSA